MYICAWQAAPLPPRRLISSRIALAAPRLEPGPPYSSGSGSTGPRLGQRLHELVGYARSRSKFPPNITGEAVAQLTDGDHGSRERFRRRPRASLLQASKLLLASGTTIPHVIHGIR